MNDQDTNFAVSRRVCNACSKYLSIAVLVSLVGQLVLDPSVGNMVSAVIATLASLITFRLVLNPRNLAIAPLPTFSVFALNVATLSGPLIAQTLSFRALAYNLSVPELTFGYSAIYQAFLLITLFVFVSTGFFKSLSKAISISFYKPIGLMSTPAPMQLWIMGIIGLAASAYLSKYSSENAGIGEADKSFNAFVFLGFAPFLMPLYGHLLPGPSMKRTRILTAMLIVFFALVLAVAVLRNSRGAFANGLTGFALSFFFATLLGQFRVTKKVRNRIIVASALFVVASPVVTDFSTAMLVARGERGTIPATELAGRTFDAFFDKKRLKAYRDVTTLRIGTGDYEEDYAANPFVQRFIQAKFIDITLAYRKIRDGQYADQIWDTTVTKALSLLPTPIIKVLGLQVDKSAIIYSMGDYFYYLEYGGDLWGFKLGSTIAHGISMLGLSFFILLIPLFLFVFTAIQSLTAVINGRIVLSPILLLTFIDIWSVTWGDSLLVAFGYLVRALPQTILTYVVLFHITRILTNFFRPRKVYRSAVTGGMPVRP